MPNYTSTYNSWQRADWQGLYPRAHAARDAALRAVVAAFDRLAEWRNRAEQRRQLAVMSERDLKDIGLGRADARREAAKPFWRP